MRKYKIAVMGATGNVGTSLLESLRRPERAVRPVGEGSVLADVPPGDDLRHLDEVLGEQARASHDVL